jgi:hypothetical protein
LRPHRSHHAPLQQLRLCLQEVFNGSHDKIATLFTAIIRAFVLRDARLHPPARLRPPARMPPPARTPSAIADAPFGDVRPMDPPGAVKVNSPKSKMARWLKRILSMYHRHPLPPPPTAAQGHTLTHTRARLFTRRNHTNACKHHTV